MNQEHSAYYQCAEKLKGMARLPTKKAKSIREALRDNTFHAVIRDAADCTLMGKWPLLQLKNFLESLEGFTDVGKEVRIYDVVYGLYKDRKLIFS